MLEANSRLRRFCLVAVTVISLSVALLLIESSSSALLTKDENRALAAIQSFRAHLYFFGSGLCCISCFVLYSQRYH